MKKNILKKYPTFFVFSILVILFTVIDIINSPNEFSELENRKLSQMPILSLKSYIDTSFSSDYEKYINDQFFLRNNWIDLKSRIEYLLGKRENNDIIFGKENYLFKKFTTFNDEMLENNLNSIITFTNNYNKEVDFFIIPNSYAIYDELTPRYLPLVDQLSLINSINSYLSLKSNDHINTINVAEELLKNKDNIQKYASYHFNQKDLFFLGRGLDFAVALEGSLKLKEISYINSEAYAGGELKHGPIALIEKGTSVITLLTQERLKDKMISNVKEVTTRGGNILAIVNDGDESAKNITDDVIYIPKTIDLLTPLLSVIPLQLLSYYIAKLKGCDVDKPRNLAKSVTVE